jgi:hypothetical protein
LPTNNKTTDQISSIQNDKHNDSDTDEYDNDLTDFINKGYGDVISQTFLANETNCLDNASESLPLKVPTLKSIVSKCLLNSAWYKTTKDGNLIKPTIVQ